MKVADEIGRQRRLLQIEYEEERDSFRKLSDRIGVLRLVERGNARWPLSVGKSWYNSLNQRIVEVTLDGEPDEDDAFEPGKQISFFSVEDHGEQKLHYLMNGTVSFSDNERLAVSVADDADLQILRKANNLGCVISFDETTYKAMFEALDRLANAKGRLGQLRDIIYTTQKAEELTFQPVRMPYLNAMQEKAVNKVLRAKDVAIVHGPPGTGKTTTLVESIYETLRRETQVLVCAQSNMAVDWICEKLEERGINVLRIGNPSRVNDRMLSSTYERRFESHPDYPELWSIRKAIRELRGCKKGSTENRHQKMDRLQSRATELELRINSSLFDEARVVASTLVGSSSRLLDSMKFSTLFIDEAAQALEAACWIPLRRAGRLILAGDHCQLPPIVKSYEAMKQGLGKSLMERIVENKPETVTLLSIQYRMHEDIMSFPNKWFYGGNMAAAQGVCHRGILSYDSAVEWIDTPADADIEYHEKTAGESFGKINKEEAELTVDILKNYIDRIGKNRIIDEQIDFGVISPYKAQVQYLRRIIRKDKWFQPFRKLISINTVDGFQGQERDVIIISMVRNNEEGQIGFLRDLRRMNVAMTRARMKLIVVGDSSTLSRHPFYRKLHEHILSINER